MSSPGTTAPTHTPTTTKPKTIFTNAAAVPGTNFPQMEIGYCGNPTPTTHAKIRGPTHPHAMPSYQKPKTNGQKPHSAPCTVTTAPAHPPPAPAPTSPHNKQPHRENAHPNNRLKSPPTANHQPTGNPSRAPSEAHAQLRAPRVNFARKPQICTDFPGNLRSLHVAHCGKNA
ncbi:hypothetical protein, no similarity [Maudiozyma barnettii]|uniref:Uncharacterized protein n=1 Tax=Maudiozyma barnettii TaxID=61262 RepID=A0A8H2VJA1_9SACH|nr:hypothetical protein, no similarity [Kazachstania barnettii]CAB4256438.1 hypothetical protein, no similarity [Kazachstania barnettii]CAD1785047.1 hypothetical protein, no similarity [Kazachstania barnettii]